VGEQDGLDVRLPDRVQGGRRARCRLLTLGSARENERERARERAPRQCHAFAHIVWNADDWRGRVRKVMSDYVKRKTQMTTRDPVQILEYLRNRPPP